MLFIFISLHKDHKQNLDELKSKIDHINHVINIHNFKLRQKYKYGYLKKMYTKQF